MTSPLLSVTFQGIGADGLALPGGKVYTYTAGTLTPKATYTAAGATNANPVILDVAGQADIRLADAGSYRIRLYTALDVLVRDADNITGQGALDALLRGDLASTSVVGKAAGQVGFNPALPYVASAPDSVGAELLAGGEERAIWHDVLAATTNNDSAIAAWLAAWKVREEAVATLHAGVHRFATPVNLTNPDGVLFAQPGGVLKYTGAVASTYGVQITDAQNRYHQKVIGPLTVLGTATAQGLVYVHKVHHSEIDLNLRDCHPGFEAFRSGHMVCNTLRLRVSHADPPFTAGAVPLNGVILGSGSGSATQTVDCLFPEMIIEGVAGNGLGLTNAVDNIFIGGTSEANGGLGVKVDAQCYGNTFINFFCEANGGDGVAGDWRLSGSRNTLLNCEATSGTGTAALLIEGLGNRIVGGRYRTIVDNGTGTVLEGCSVTVTGGLSGTGLSTQRRQAVYNEATMSFYADRNGGFSYALTLSLGGSTTDGTVTYTTLSGDAQEIDGAVTFSAIIQVNAVTVAPTGDLLLRGLPTAARLARNHPVSVVHSGITLPAGRVELGAEVVGNNTYIRFPAMASGVALAMVPGSGIAAGSILSVSGSYLTN